MCKDEFKEVEETVYEKVCSPGYTKAETPYSQRVKRQSVESYSAPIDSYGAPSAPLLPPTPQPCQTNDPRFTFQIHTMPYNVHSQARVCLLPAKRPTTRVRLCPRRALCLPTERPEISLYLLSRRHAASLPTTETLSGWRLEARVCLPAWRPEEPLPRGVQAGSQGQACPEKEAGLQQRPTYC